MARQITVNGITYSSLKAAAKAHGVDPRKVAYHLRVGNSIDKAFTKTNCNDKPICASGIEYPSITEAAKAVGLNPTKISERLRKGWTAEQALEIDKSRLRQGGKGSIYLVTNNRNGKQYVGLTVKSIEQRWLRHIQNALKGSGREGTLAEAIREFGASAFSIKELVAADNIGNLGRLERKYIQQFNTQYPNGYNIKLGGEMGFASQKPVTIGGMRFDSLPAAARHFKIDESTLRHRIKTGWSFEQITGAEKPPPPSYAKETTVGGIKFESMKAAAIAHEIDIGTVQYRIGAGWSIEQAFGLQPPPENLNPLAQKIFVNGKSFKSKRAAALAHGVDYSTFKARLRLGWALEEALGIKARE